MNATTTTAIATAAGRGAVTRLPDARRQPSRTDPVLRARDARRRLRPRSERFAHLKRMYD